MNLLTRKELKMIIGGDEQLPPAGEGGRMYCNVGGTQIHYDLYDNGDLLGAVEACVTIAETDGMSCGGCAYFSN